MLVQSPTSERFATQSNVQQDDLFIIPSIVGDSCSTLQDSCVESTLELVLSFVYACCLLTLGRVYATLLIDKLLAGRINRKNPASDKDNPRIKENSLTGYSTCWLCGSATFK